MIGMYVVAVVLVVSGNRLKIDKGLIDGLQEEDRGRVCYTLRVNDERKLVEAVDCRVVEADDSTAIVELAQPYQVRTGFLVRFALPVDRTTPASLLKLGQKRLSEKRFDSAIRYFERIKKTLPDDALVEGLIQEAEKGKRDQAEREEELKKVDYYLAEAESSLGSEEHSVALDWVSRVLRVVPGHPRGIALKLRIEQDVERHETMILIEAGKFEIGVDRGQARFYNQQPQFKTELSAFWIDRAASDKTAFTFDEAEEYCRKQGKRLPTEFELEIGSLQPGFHVSSHAEWTTSWYLPYPGNQMIEEQYGQKYRVIRGPDDLRVRTFLLPAERAIDTSFRCACSAPPPARRDAPTRE